VGGNSILFQLDFFCSSGGVLIPKATERILWQEKSTSAAQRMELHGLIMKVLQRQDEHGKVGERA
jgi:hypothetical protein